MLSKSSEMWNVKQNFELYLKIKIPKFEVILKEDSKFMKFLSYLLFFVPNFMTWFNTTIYPRVYVVRKVSTLSSESEISSYLQMIFHEGQHLLDRLSWGVWFNFLYVFPQILSIFAILAIWNLWFLVFLIFLLPLPSTRAIVEYRGYCASIALAYWCGGRRDVDAIVENFANSNYYFMFPFKGFMKRKFEAFVSDLENDGELPEYINFFKGFFE